MQNIFYLLFILSALHCTRHFNTKATTEDGIKISSMEQEGINAAIINLLDSAITKGVYPNIHSVLIAKNNKLVYEKYWSGTDQNWRHDVGRIAHSKDSLHDIRSITKSFVSACIGIAIERGKIKSVDQNIFEFFPEYAKQDTGLKSTLTIKHLLTMSSGLLWNEDTPSYDDPANSEVQMIKSSNPLEFVLSQPMASPPGKVWKYNGGTTQLLAAIVEKSTGKKIDECAKQYLFDPLGIKNFTWEKFPQKELTKGFSGIRITSRDLLKFGLLYNQNGKWNNKQILSPNWIEESFQSHIKREEIKARAYGYQFWMWKDTVNNYITKFIAAVGNGDQRIYFDKTNDLVIVITAGNYYKNIEKNSYAILKEYIYPALIKK